MTWLRTKSHRRTAVIILLAFTFTYTLLHLRSSTSIVASAALQKLEPTVSDDPKENSGLQKDTETAIRQPSSTVISDEQETPIKSNNVLKSDSQKKPVEKPNVIASLFGSKGLSKPEQNSLLRNTIKRLSTKLTVAPPPPVEVRKASHLVIVPGHAIFMPRPALNDPEHVLNDHLANARNGEQRPPSMEMPRDAPVGVPGRFDKRSIIPKESETKSQRSIEKADLNMDDKAESNKDRLEKSVLNSKDTVEDPVSNSKDPIGKPAPNSKDPIKRPAPNSKDSSEKLELDLEESTQSAQDTSTTPADQIRKDTQALSGKLQDEVDDDADLMRLHGDPLSSLPSPSSPKPYKSQLNVFSNTRSLLDAKDEENWMISSFQKGQTETFLKHIRVAAKIARKDPNAVLVLSGGQTQQFAGPYSEAQSYWTLAASVLNEYDVADVIYDGGEGNKEEKVGRAGEGSHLVNRMLVEDFATDSYENLLFGIARFREYTGKYPEKITVVGLDLKKERFENVHRAALRFPAAKFRYVGIDPPELHSVSKSNSNRDQVTENAKDDSQYKKSPRYIQALLGERKNALEPFTKDPHGCKEPTLVEKRRMRNPFRRSHPYLLSCPEMFNLLTICSNEVSTEEVYKNLPWVK